MPQPGDPNISIQLNDPSNHLGLATQTPTSEQSDLQIIDPPDHAVPALQTWNQSKSNITKMSATFFSFIIIGANEAVYGALLPYLGTYYKVSYTAVSLIFLSPLLGYVSAASVNNFLHQTFGQRGVAVIGCGSHLLAYIVISFHPPYPVLVIVFIVAGFGNGVLDAAWNAWLSSLANPNELLGFLHGCAGVGAVITPLTATAMFTRGGYPWYSFYYIMIGAAVIELAVTFTAFRHESSAKYKAFLSGRSTHGATRAALKTRVVWVASIFLLIYVGTEVAIGGWIVEFMIKVRQGSAFDSGLTATWFWLGLTLGRVILGFVTPRIGENMSICIYLICAMAMQLVFWLVPSFVTSSITVAIIGFFLGPLFPAAIVATTRLLKPELHVAAIGFAAAMGGGGAAVLPFAVGAIAQDAGVGILQPIILAMLVVTILLWGLGMPKFSVADERMHGKRYTLEQYCSGKLLRMFRSAVRAT